ncbi:hypothetical protein RUND412_002334 [Rhizina undulata]
MAALQNSSFTLQQLLEKMSSPDSDFRFMSLNDLLTNLTNPTVTFAQIDSSLLGRMIDGVIRALDDGNGEVQNLAVKCLGPLCLKVRDSQIAPIIDRLSTLTMTAQDPSIPSTGLRAIITSLPRPISSSAVPAPPSAGTSKLDAPQQALLASITAIQKTLLPKLLALLKPGTDLKEGSASLDSIDLLIETLRCFGVILTGAEVERFQVAVMNLLEGPRTSGVVKKRAVVALSLLCLHAPDELLSSFISHIIESFQAQNEHVNPNRLRLLISVASALARGIPQRFGPYLKILCPFVLSVVDGKDIQDRDLGEEPDMEMDEVREAALVALESFQTFCPGEMTRFTDDLINAGKIYLKYDPNYADPGDDEDDEEMGGIRRQDVDDEEDEFGGSDDGDEFEEDGNFSDEDDISWKVRRCAAKLLSTVISTKPLDLIKSQEQGGGRAYKEIAPLLVERFNEREENVRLEVLATATVLVAKTGEVAEGNVSSPTPSTETKVVEDVLMGPPPKKRRGSDLSMLDSSIDRVSSINKDEVGVKENLKALIPKLSRSLSKVIKAKGSNLPTKQASITLLSSIVSVLHGGLEDVLSLFIGPLVDAAKGSSSFSSAGGAVIAASAAGGSAATATASSLRIEVLKLIGKICDTHSLGIVSDYLDALVPAVVVAVKESGYKISSEALGASVSISRLLTSEGVEDYSSHLQFLLDAILEKIQSIDADLEVREKAIIALGVILSNTSGEEKWFGREKRKKALDLLLERLRNETTRIMAVRAISDIAKSTKNPDDVSAEWVSAVVVECGGQLRKANRSLRAASLEGLRSVASNENCRRKLAVESRKELVEALTPLLVVGDLHLLASALTIIKLAMVDADGVGATPTVIEAICALVRSPLGSGAVIENLIGLVKTIGEVDNVGKKELMACLLRKVGIEGETGVVAKVVAQLLVSGGGREGGFAVDVEDVVGEVESSKEDRKRCLGLMVLGEVGLRMGPRFPVGPDVFMNQFRAKSDDVPIAAAVALGLAAAGNIDGYVPVIMEKLKSGDKDQYLLLHSLKEVIQHSSSNSNIGSYADQIWKSLFEIAKNDDSKAVGAECVGRLIIIDPYSFLPELQKHLGSEEGSTRGMVMSALRYTFTDTEESYDELLRPIVVDFLTVMVDDKELENRRLALTALNSAAHNKPHLILPHLERLLPLVYRETVVRPELVREVMMGPFKHKVDDGLEVRKSAFETLYALLETSYSAIDIKTFYDRLLAGLQDEHDIRILCNLMLTKLIRLAREETLLRLDAIGECFKNTLSQKPKENAVKQELEKHAESIRSTMRATLALNKEFPVAGCMQQRKWLSYWDWVKVAFVNDIHALEGEERQVKV